MLAYSYHSSRTRYLTIALAVLVAISGLAAGARAWRRSVGERLMPIAQMESELITVTPHGFEPREITRPPGAFLLLIDNRSGLNTVNPRLTLDTLDVLDLTIPREQPDWSDVLNLQPGVYLLTETGHPGWLCRVTITP